jgi:hypothetical protein
LGQAARSVDVPDMLRGGDVMKKMKYRSVNSSNVVSVGYDHAAEVLGVIFKSGATYHYRGVHRGVHDAIIEESKRVKGGVFGASVGRLVSQHIVGKFLFDRVDPVAIVHRPPLILEDQPAARGSISDQSADFFSMASDLIRGE